MRDLRKSEKILIAAVGIFICALLMQNFILLPFSDKLKDITGQVRVDEKNLIRLLYLDSQGEDIGKSYEAIRPYVKIGKTEEDTLSVVMKKIEELAKECDVILLNMKPEADRTREENFYKSKKVELSIEGSQRGIVEFAYRLENSDYPLRINRMDFKIKNRAQDLMEADMSVNFIYFSK